MCECKKIVLKWVFVNFRRKGKIVVKKIETTHVGDNKLCYKSTKIVFDAIASMQYATSFDVKKLTGITNYFAVRMMGYLVNAGLVKKADELDAKRQFCYQKKRDFDDSDRGKILLAIHAEFDTLEKIKIFTEMSTPCLNREIVELLQEGCVVSYVDEGSERFSIVPALNQVFKVNIPEKLIQSTVYISGVEKVHDQD